ncbi:hypothetical protein L1887_57295 [Cichorium endivia]|nr:hypothetical protein L1887_57295 [Cichorium endivia]
MGPEPDAPGHAITATCTSAIASLPTMTRAAQYYNDQSIPHLHAASVARKHRAVPLRRLIRCSACLRKRPARTSSVVGPRPSLYRPQADMHGSRSAWICTVTMQGRGVESLDAGRARHGTHLVATRAEATEDYTKGTTANVTGP